MRRSLRRFKTFNHREKMKKKLRRSWGYDRVEGDVHPSFAEHPTCPCSMCNRKNSWEAKTRKRVMRNEERMAIREYYRSEKD